MRYVIIHYHMFKNAGTTVDAILEANFGSRWASIDGPNPWDTLRADTVLQHVRDNPALVALSSHHARLPLPADPQIDFHPLVFLRHPIDRVGSVYWFERRQPESHPGPGAKVAHETDFAGYVKWRLADGNGAVIRNFHIVHLSSREGNMKRAAATDADYRAAFDRLSGLPYFGIVERFDDSIARMKDYLAEHFGQIDTRHGVENKTAGRKETLDQRLAEIEQSLGAELHRELLDKNALDLKLYGDALRLFDRSPRPDVPVGVADRDSGRL